MAAQGALASVYTDPDDPEGFSAGFVEAVDGQHVLMCDLSPWGQIDGWRVRRNQDVIQVLAGEEYEQRLAMLLAYHKQHHRCFFTEAPAEDTDLLLSVLIACKAVSYTHLLRKTSARLKKSRRNADIRGRNISASSLSA